jgi:hypothetical protein
LSSASEGGYDEENDDEGGSEGTTADDRGMLNGEEIQLEVDEGENPLSSVGVMVDDDDDDEEKNDGAERCRWCCC